MRHAITRLGLLLLGALFSLGGACPEPECDPDAPVCEWAVCADHPECVGREICDNEIDDDEDGDVDADDADCDEAPSPVTNVTCVGQETDTNAGDDTDSVLDGEDCQDPVASDSEDGDTAQVLVEETGAGVVEVAIDVVDGDASDPAPTATSTVTIRVDYEPGGNRTTFSAFGASANGDVVLGASCQSLGYTIEIDGRGWVPTDRLGGSFFCIVDLAALGAGSYRALIGTLLADDTDGDGVSDRNDVYCPGYGEEAGCEKHGFYAGVEYFCPHAETCHFESFPTPGFCSGECTVVTEHAIIQVDEEGENILVEADGDVRLEGGTAEGTDGNWSLDGTGTSSTIDANGSVSCFNPYDSDFCDLQVASHEVGCPAGPACRLYADRAALASDDPESVTIDKETTDEDFDGNFSFTLETAGRSYDASIETSGGLGTSSILFVFADGATVTENATPGFAIVGHDCPGAGAVAALSESATCLWTNEPVAIVDFVETLATGLETASIIPPNFAGLGFGELLAVSGSNGLDAYDTADFSRVPVLSEVNGFNLRELRGSVHLDAPVLGATSGLNDARFTFTATGTLTTQWFPENPGYGASLFGFDRPLDATVVAGDPTRGIYATATRIGDLHFTDAGLDWPLVQSATLQNGAPIGFSIRSVFQIAGSDDFLFTAESNTPGANGRLYLGTVGSAAVPIGDLGGRPLVMRCASAVDGIWICVAPNFESDTAHVIVWDGGPTVAITGSFPTGDQPLLPAVFADGDEVAFVGPNFGSDDATVVRLDGATGAQLGAPTTVSAPSACDAPSSGTAVQNGATVALTCREGLWLFPYASYED